MLRRESMLETSRTPDEPASQIPRRTPLLSSTDEQFGVAVVEEITTLEQTRSVQSTVAAMQTLAYQDQAFAKWRSCLLPSSSAAPKILLIGPRLLEKRSLRGRARTSSSTPAGIGGRT